MTVLFEWITGFDKSIAEANRVPPYGNVIIYKKAPLVLYQLMIFVGEYEFISYCRTFLKRPGCYEWKDFLKGLEEYTGIELEEYNDRWVNNKSVPSYSENESIILVDNRTEAEKQMDYYISKFYKDHNTNKLFEWLINQEIEDGFWNKYHYYLGICYFRNKDLEKAKECCSRLNKNKDIKYYWEGVYLKAKLEVEVGNFLKGTKYINEIFATSYPVLGFHLG